MICNLRLLGAVGGLVLIALQPSTAETVAEGEAFVVLVSKGNYLSLSQATGNRLVVLYGIECDDPFQTTNGRQAKEFVQAAAEGKRCRVRTVESKFGLDHVEIFTAEGVCLNLELLQRGLARLHPDLPTSAHAYHAALKRSEISASRDSRQPELDSQEKVTNASSQYLARKQLMEDTEYDLAYLAWVSMGEEERTQILRYTASTISQVRESRQEQVAARDEILAEHELHLDSTLARQIEAENEDLKSRRAYESAVTNALAESDAGAFDAQADFWADRSRSHRRRYGNDSINVDLTEGLSNYYRKRADDERRTAERRIDEAEEQREAEERRIQAERARLAAERSKTQRALRREESQMEAMYRDSRKKEINLANGRALATRLEEDLRSGYIPLTRFRRFNQFELRNDAEPREVPVRAGLWAITYSRSAAFGRIPEGHLQITDPSGKQIVHDLELWKHRRVIVLGEPGPFTFQLRTRSPEGISVTLLAADPKQ